MAGRSRPVPGATLLKGLFWIILLLAFAGFPQPLAAVLLVAVLGGWLLRLATAPARGRACRRGRP